MQVYRSKLPVTGIAMGMISDAKTGKYAILSDILGDEDHLEIWISRLQVLKKESLLAKWT
jgi:hypothetical protein